MITNLKDIEKLLQEHDNYRSKCLNLIAAENYASVSIRKYLSSDFSNRYGNYATLHPEEREYTGNRYIHEFEMATHELIKDVFKTTYVDLRPIGGHMAGVATVLGLTAPGDLVLEISGKDWGHELVWCMRNDVQFEQSIRLDFLPFDNNKILDIDKLNKMINNEKPKLIILGGSGTLFPEPTDKLKSITGKYNIFLGYDFSHVAGLIAGGVFPNPLEQGADVVFGSTHKSFPGPQGGMVLSHNIEIIKKIGDALFPALITSHHLNRLPALAATLIEMKKYGNAYGKQIIKNSKSLGKAMEEVGFKVIASEKGYSETHLILVDVTEFGNSADVARLLERANILCSDDWGRLGTQIRIGTSEITRRGMEEKEMIEIADSFKRVLMDREEPSKIVKDVGSFTRNFPGIRYSLD